jgi:DNA-binding beta-propeller fold protein YncE
MASLSRASLVASALFILSAAACGDSSSAPPIALGLPAGGAAGAQPDGGRSGAAGAPSAGQAGAAGAAAGGAGGVGGDANAGAAGAAGASPEAVVEVFVGNTATGWADGVGLAARFNGPAGGALSADGSTLYVADTFNSVLRRVDLATGQVATVAGRPFVQATADGVGSAARFATPRAVAMAPDGASLYVADGPTIRRVSLADYAVTTVAGTPGQAGYADGVGAGVRLGFLLHDFAFSESGATLYVADRSNRVLRAFSPTTGEVSTLAGTPYAGAAQHADGVGTAARFSGLGALARVGGALYAADTFNHVLRRIDLTTLEVTTVAGAPGLPGLDDGSAASARFDTPQGLVAHGGFLYSTSFDGVLRRISLADFSVATVLGDASDPRAIDGTSADARLGLAFAPPLAHPTENALFYQDRSASSVRRIDLGALSVTTVVGAKDPQATRDGSLAEARFDAPAGLAATADGATWYIADEAAHVVRRIDAAAGTVGTLAGQPGEAGALDGPLDAARFDAPAALALDEAAGRLYVLDGGNLCLRAIDLGAGTVVTLAGRPGVKGADDGPADQATFAGPRGLALDAAGGRLFVTDVGAAGGGLLEARATVRVVDLAARTVDTLVGATPATPPLGGAFAEARLSSPSALAFDPAGQRLFVAETGRSTLHVVDLVGGTVATLAGRDDENGPGDGPFADARFDAPNGLVWSGAEAALYVTDLSTVRRLDFAAQTVSTWLGDPTRRGGLVPGVLVSFADATLYFPGAPVIAGGALGFVSEHAVYRARPTAGLKP